MRGALGVRMLAAVAALWLWAAPLQAGEGIWLGLSAPSQDAIHTGPTALVEVKGRAGAGLGAGHDVVIVLDVSASTLLASGADVDGDGVVGRTSRRVLRALRQPAGWQYIYSPRQLSSDGGDTIRAAEIAAARRLVELLDPEFTRVGLVVFHRRARLEVPVGRDHSALRAALDRLAEDDLATGATDFQAAIETALEALAEAGDGAGEPRQRAILFLSDGQPTEPPGGDRPVDKALEATAHAAEAGVRLHTFALGPDAIEHYGVFAEMAEATGGVLTQVEEPAEIVSKLPRIDLAKVDGIALVNETLGAEGRALRVLPDGSFDGFIRLAPGENVLRVTARASSGEETELTRRIRFELREPQGAREVALHRLELERLHQTLQRRTVLTRELAEIERARRGLSFQAKDLELQVEPPRSAFSAAPATP